MDSGPATSNSSAFANMESCPDLLENPLALVQECFVSQAAISSTVPTPVKPSFHLRVSDAFRRYFERQPNALSGVPLVDPRTWAADSAPMGPLRKHRLVRFRGMVVDMLDPQFFSGMQRDPASGRVVCTMYREALTTEEAAAGAKWEPHGTVERRPLLLGPIPGEAGWVGRSRSTGIKDESALIAKKRSFCANASGTEMDTSLTAPLSDGPAKVARLEESKANGMDLDDASTLSNAPPPCPLPADSLEGLHGLQGPESFRCLAYFYDGEEGPYPPKLNEALDVVAILSYTSAEEKDNMAGGRMEGEEEDMDVAGGADGATWRYPRLHVLLWERAGPMLLDDEAEAGGIAPSPLPSASSRAPAPSIFAGASVPRPRPLRLTQGPDQIAHARAETVRYFARHLEGDILAAEYLLLALLSRVRLRRGGGETVGNLPVNISRVKTPGLAKGLSRLLARVVARSRSLPVTLARLRDPRAWISQKDYGTNLLSTTPLQAAPGTALVLDETGLETGRLDAAGVANVQCLKGLIESQKTSCNFGYYKLDFEADCPMLVVSKSRSIFHGGALCEVPLAPASAPVAAGTSHSISAAAVSLPMGGGEEGREERAEEMSPEALASLRRYLAALAGFPVEIGEDLARHAEEEYVTLRGREAGKDLRPEDLSRWLTLTRLLSASEGSERACKRRHWDRMREMERERVGRLRGLEAGSVAQ